MCRQDIFHTLATQGRLPFHNLRQRSDHTPQEVWHGLAVLVQQNLAFWFEDPRIEVTYYEANFASAYALVRSGKHTRAAQNRLGSQAASVVASVLSTGPVELQALEPAEDVPGCSEVNRKTAPPNVNGASPKSKRNESQIDLDPREEKVYEAVYGLLQHRFLAVAHGSNFHSEADNRTLAEQEVTDRSLWSFPLKAKERARFEEAADELLEEWAEGPVPARDPAKDGLSSNDKGSKRQFEDEAEEQPIKRRRLNKNADLINGEAFASEQSAILQKDTVLRVNQEKIAVAARTDKLIQLCEEEIGPATSEVFKTLLRILEKNASRCNGISGKPEVEDGYDERVSAPRVPTDNVFSEITNFEALQDSIVQADESQVDPKGLELYLKREKKRNLLDGDAENSKKRKRQENDNRENAAASGSGSGPEKENENEEILGSDHGLNGFITSDSDAASDASFAGPNAKKPPSKKPKTTHNASSAKPAAVTLDNHPDVRLVRQHLLLLAAHAPPLLTYHPARRHRPEAWSVPLRSLATHLRLRALLASLSARHGPLAPRLARLLHDRGRLDEKTLAQRALVPPKPLRALLDDMLAAGHVELCEVPRDGQRAPSRTVFVWGFDVERCARAVLGEVYRAMARLLQRLKVEGESVRGVREKAERTDVVGREAELLGEEELAVLERWRGTEERIWGEMGRLDDMVMVLRDF